MKKTFLLQLTLFLCFATSSGQNISSADWPQWRGPNRDGMLSVEEMPAQWPDQLQRIWQIQVGEGHASPVVWHNRIFVFSRQDGREVISSIRPEDGQVLWQQSYPAPYTMSFAAYSHGKGPKSTPAVADGKVITLGISGILSCHRAGDGNLLWRKKFSNEFKKTSPLYGAAMSPLIVDGLCIIHVGGNDDGALVAIKCNTGEEKWRWAGDGPAYSSPILAELSSTKQIVTFSQERIIGIDLQDGALLWQIPFTTPWTQNIHTPVLYENDLILSGLQQGVMRVKVTKNGDAWTTEQIWKNRDVWTYMSSPVLFDDLLVLFSDKRKGVYATLDPNSGQILWQSQGRAGDNAALVRTGDFILSLQTDSRLIVSKRDGKKFEVIKEYDMADSPVWAHPAFFEKHILVKDKTALTLWKVQ